jgi:hypothetical protein
MECYVVAECKPGATLVVMGSAQITSNVFDSVVVSWVGGGRQVLAVLQDRVLKLLAFGYCALMLLAALSRRAPDPLPMLCPRALSL